jgi:hypothetical protein
VDKTMGGLPGCGAFAQKNREAFLERPPASTRFPPFLKGGTAVSSCALSSGFPGPRGPLGKNRLGETIANKSIADDADVAPNCPSRRVWFFC